MWWNKTVNDVLHNIQESLEDLDKIVEEQQVKIDDYDDIISLALARQKAAEVEQTRAAQFAEKFRKLFND